MAPRACIKYSATLPRMALAAKLRCQRRPAGVPINQLLHGVAFLGISAKGLVTTGQSFCKTQI